MVKFLSGLILGMVIGAGFLYFLSPNIKEVFLKNEDDYSKLALSLKKLEKDKDFYSNIDYYSALLTGDDWTYFKNIPEKTQSSDIGKKIKDLFVLITMSHLFSVDEKFEEIVTKLKDNINLSRETNIDENDLFQKNTSCSGLVSSLSESLEKDESFDFIFYSSTKKSCIYSTNYSYDSRVTSNYYSYTEKRLYNGTTHSKIGNYLIYSYKYPTYSSEEERKKAVENGKREYIKFILENSNYNTDLFEGVSGIYHNFF